MAKLLDSIEHLDDAVRRKFKKLFERLSDDYCVRTLALEDVAIAPLAIQGPENSWLFLGYYSSNPNRQTLEKYTQFSQALAKVGLASVKLLAVTDTGRTMFDEHDSAAQDVIILEKKSFFADGTEEIQKALTCYPKEDFDRIRKRLYFESHINPICTLRKPKVSHDNSARINHQFLDYDQEMAIRLDLNSVPDTREIDDSGETRVRLINGVAGSGKTLILINRALYYCKMNPDHPVLLLIHNNPIVAEIKNKINSFKGGKPDNLRISTFHKHAYRLNHRMRGRTQVIYKEEKITEKLSHLLGKQNQYASQLLLSPQQIISELEFINDFLVDSLEEYLETERHGRGFALGKTQRQNIWQLYLQARALLSNQTCGYWASGMIKDICLHEKLDDNIEQYEHILIDEAQFFAPSWLYLVKKSLSPNGQLFICADPNQGFLKSRLSWKSLGLNVAGRTKKLKHSYRTTYEILLAANSLLKLLDEDSEDFVKPSFEDMERGEKPLVIYSDNQQDEVKRLSNEVKAILDEQSLAPEKIIILCAECHNPFTLKQELESRLGEGRVMNCNNRNELNDDPAGKIRLMTINSCTGVEAILTFVIGVGHLVQKASAIELSDDERNIAFHESMRKLYVAMTRASQLLVLFSTVPLPVEVDEFVIVDDTQEC